MSFVEAFKFPFLLAAVAVKSLDQAQLTHLEEVVGLQAFLLGVMTSNGTNQVQIFLNLTIPKHEAVLVQWIHFSCFSSDGSAGHAMPCANTALFGLVENLCRPLHVGVLERVLMHAATPLFWTSEPCVSRW